MTPDAAEAILALADEVAVGVDDEILWESVSSDLPVVRDRLIVDAAEARAVIDRLLADQAVDPGVWDREHLRDVASTDPD